MRQGLPALPMHDGMTVGESTAAKALRAMEAAALRVYGILLSAIRKSGG